MRSPPRSNRWRPTLRRGVDSARGTASGEGFLIAAEPESLQALYLSLLERKRFAPPLSAVLIRPRYNSS